jgi:hypothetical protein
MLRSQISQCSKILSRVLKITSEMKPNEKLDELTCSRSSRDKLVFNPTLSKNKLFDVIRVISTQKLFSKVVSTITGIYDHGINGVKWFESAVNKRELAIAIGAGSTTYSKGKTGFTFFKNKELKHRKSLKLARIKKMALIKYRITTKEEKVLEQLEFNSEHIQRMKEGFKTHNEIIVFANELAQSRCKLHWTTPTKRTTVSKRLNGCNGHPVQPKLPLICVLGFISPEQSYAFNLAKRPEHSILCSTEGLANKLTVWENANRKLSDKARRVIYARFQADDHTQLSNLSFSNKLHNILLGVDTRKSPSAGFESKDAMQSSLDINQHQVNKILNGCDKSQALIDKRKKPFSIADQYYTLTDVAKKTGLTLMAAYQRVKKHKGKANDFELIFAPKYQKGLTSFQGNKSVLTESESFYVVDYQHPEINDELIKFGRTSKTTTDERLSDHSKSSWRDMVIIHGPTKLIRKLERVAIAHRECMNLKQPVVKYIQNKKVRPVSGYNDILLKSEFTKHFQMLLSEPEKYCYRFLHSFAKSEGLALSKLSVTCHEIEVLKKS